MDAIRVLSWPRYDPWLSAVSGLAVGVMGLLAR